jgi:hypothetical protein
MSKKEGSLKLELGWRAAIDIFAALAMLLFVFFVSRLFEFWATVAWQCLQWYLSKYDPLPPFSPNS